MGRNEEGGVLTQKLNMSIFAMALLLFAGVAGVIVVADDASAESNATATVKFEEDRIATEGKTSALLTFSEVDIENFVSVSWKAELDNSSGKSAGSNLLSATEGSSVNPSDSWNITVTAPKTAGTYTLKVTFTESANVDGQTKDLPAVVRTATLKVAEPITLSVTISNKADSPITGASVYFKVDGTVIEDSKTTLDIAANGVKTVTYKYYNKDLSSGKHTYTVVPAEGAYIEGLDGNAQSFYYKQGTQDYMTYIMVVIMIIVLISLIVVYRKPVRNYGKPKARR